MSDPKVMTILYGRDGTKGVAKHIRDETNRILHNYLGEMSNNEIEELIQEIEDYEDFPDFVIDWEGWITTYLEERD